MVAFIGVVSRAGLLILVLGVDVAYAATPRDACFGGSAMAVATGEVGARDVFVANGFLYWRSREIRRMNLKTTEVVSIGNPGNLKAVDGRDAVGTTGVNEIVGVDLRTKSSRTIYENARMNDLIVFSTMGLEGDYLYFNRPPDRLRPESDVGFFRVRREAGSSLERLAAEPAGYLPFIIGRGFVYWVRRADDGIVIARRPLAPGGDRKSTRLNSSHS